MLVGFGGVAAIFSEDFDRLGGPGVAFAAVVLLAAPLVSAMGSVSVKRWGAGIHPLSLTAVPMGITALIMGAMAWFTERHATVVLDFVAVATIVYLALMGTALTFTLYYWLLGYLPATRMALISYTTPLVAVLVGTLVMDEPFTLRILIGSVLVVLGVALALQTGPSTRRLPADRE
jgi:drug/metabolite transporter (DMT)-like permease